MRIRMILLALTAAVAAVGVSSASAAVFVAFDRHTAAPGETVSGYTANSLGERAPFIYKEGGVELYVYLVPRGLASRISTPRDLRNNNVRAVGELIGDEQSIGHVKFKVPDVPPGVYATRVWCPSCGSFLPDRRPTTNVGQMGLLRVTERRESSVVGPVPAAALAVLLAAAVGAGVFRFRRRAASA